MQRWGLSDGTLCIHPNPWHSYRPTILRSSITNLRSALGLWNLRIRITTNIRLERSCTAVKALVPQMTDLYLIAHKVHGEPAFDIACKLDCPECEGLGPEYKTIAPCIECDSLGFWWIIPTSGHRAYTYYDIRLDEIEFEGNGHYCLSEELTKMPPSLPDHYLPTAEPKAPSLLDRLNLRPIQPPIVRRI